MSQRAIASLEDLGFSTYEAKAYWGLIQENPISGYRLSKRTGIPRSRIYEILERLAVKGLAIQFQADPVEYAPLAVEDLMMQLRGDFDDTLSVLETEVERLSTKGTQESIWNLRTREMIIKRARAMITRAQKSVYLVAWAETIQELRAELKDAANQGIRIVTISCGEIEPLAGIHYKHAFEEELVQMEGSSIIVVIDGNQVLLGETLPADSCQAAWSNNAGLIFVTEEYIRHEVYIHKIIERLSGIAGQTLQEALSEGLNEIPY
jgi:sugar-specific transcriptional regulator TrmB